MQVAIMVYPGMTALDAIGPYELLRGLRDCDLRFVWKEVGPIVTDSGVLIIGATHTFDETPSPDLVLVPGSGPSTTVIMNDADAIAWLRAVHPHTRLTTSVCSGALILAAAGLLEGREATSHWAAIGFLERFGAVPKPHDRIVRAGKIITAAGVSAGIDLGLILVAEIDGEERARVAQLTIEYDPQPPFDSGHMDKASVETRRAAKREMRRVALNRPAVFAFTAVMMRRWKDTLFRARRVSND